MRPPCCPARDWRSIRFFTPASGIIENEPDHFCRPRRQGGGTYSIPINYANGTNVTLQELGDATMLSNGNIVFCRKVGASEITPDKKIIWNIDAPQGTEIHSIQPIGLDRVLVTQNGNPAKLMLINTGTGKRKRNSRSPC